MTGYLPHSSEAPSLVLPVVFLLSHNTCLYQIIRLDHRLLVDAVDDILCG